MSAPGERPDGPAPAAPEPTGAQAAAPLTFDRHLVIEQLGGWRGMVDASLPTIAFIVANSLGGLRTGIWAALGVALVVFVLRLVRRESVQQAFSGLIAVGVAVAIAASSGQARDFFVLGILRNAGLGAVLLASIPFRRPLVGVIAEFLAPSHLGSLADHSLPGLRRWDRSHAPLRPGAGETDPSTGVRDPDPEPECHWRDDPRMLRAYNWLTVLWGAVFLVRAVVQWLLYLQDAVTALGTVSVILGLPVTAAEVVVTLWVVARLHRHRSADRRADDGPTAPGD
jgi:NADH:ubiquinone oxidoreductase subunit K